MGDPGCPCRDGSGLCAGVRHFPRPDFDGIGEARQAGSGRWAEGQRGRGGGGRAWQGRAGQGLAGRWLGRAGLGRAWRAGPPVPSWPRRSLPGASRSRVAATVELGLTPALAPLAAWLASAPVNPQLAQSCARCWVLSRSSGLASWYSRTSGLLWEGCGPQHDGNLRIGWLLRDWVRPALSRPQKLSVRVGVALQLWTGAGPECCVTLGRLLSLSGSQGRRRGGGFRWPSGVVRGLCVQILAGATRWPELPADAHSTEGETEALESEGRAWGHSGAFQNSSGSSMAPPWVPAVGFTLMPNVGAFVASSFIHGDSLRWHASLRKPSWHPPRWALPPIWGTLYSAMGYGSYMVWKELGGFTEEAVVPLGLYAGQLTLNLAWPPIFFGARQMGWALVDLLLLSGTAAATTVAWYRVSPPAGRILFPYLAWLAFATTLNYCIWRDNRGRRGGGRFPE